jgi:hypothetical protein
MVNFPTAVALFFVGSAIATVLPRPLQEDRRATTGYKKHKRWKGAGGGAKKTTTPTSSSGSGGGAKRGRGGGISEAFADADAASGRVRSRCSPPR